MVTKSLSDRAVLHLTMRIIISFVQRHKQWKNQLLPTCLKVRCDIQYAYKPTTGCCVATATQQPDVSAYTKCDVQLIKVAPDDGLI